jgi:hypothetical protein
VGLGRHEWRRWRRRRQLTAAGGGRLAELGRKCPSGLGFTRELHGENTGTTGNASRGFGRGAGAGERWMAAARGCGAPARHHARKKMGEQREKGLSPSLARGRGRTRQAGGVRERGQGERPVGMGERGRRSWADWAVGGGEEKAGWLGLAGGKGETLLEFPPNTTQEMRCNMPFLGAIATIAPKQFHKKVLQKVPWY